MARIRARSISKQGSAEIVRNQSNLGPAVHELDARRGIVADDTAAAVSGGRGGRACSHHGVNKDLGCHW